MSGERKRRRFWLKLAAGLLFAVVAYGGAYLSTVVPAIGYPRLRPERPIPHYRNRNPELQPVLRVVFAPAHWVDERVRPWIWEPR